jgi:hypothetical protein
MTEIWPVKARSLAAPSSGAGTEFWPHSSEQKVDSITTPRKATPRSGRVCATEYTKNSTEGARKLEIQEIFCGQSQRNQYVPECDRPLLR